MGAGVLGVAAVLLANRALAAGRGTALPQAVLLVTVLSVLATIGLTIYLLTINLGYSWWDYLLNVLVSALSAPSFPPASFPPASFPRYILQRCDSASSPPPYAAPARPCARPPTLPACPRSPPQMLIQRLLFFVVGSMALYTLWEADKDTGVAGHVAAAQGVAPAPPAEGGYSVV